MKRIAMDIADVLWSTFRLMSFVILFPLVLFAGLAIVFGGIELLISLVPIPTGGEH